MAAQIDQKLISQNVQNEMAKKQQAIIRQYQKPLSMGKNMKLLQDFLMSQKTVGSAAYLELSPILQEIVLKLNLSSIEILVKNEKNPFKKLRYKIAIFATKKMASARKAKGQLDKEKARKKQTKIEAKKQKDKKIVKKPKNK
ncbi:MAG: hypothetical protein LBH98_03100 [Chitinispirillales bacterium]|jgi:hypothetical protein|nr:hypothetical protein [Chitinispirillales bacterium]